MITWLLACSGTNSPDDTGTAAPPTDTSTEACDTALDEDADGDGWKGYADCNVTLDRDCDDTDPDTHPEAKEICNDGKDQDCFSPNRDCTFGGVRADSDADGFLTSAISGDDWWPVHLAVLDATGDGIEDVFFYDSDSVNYMVSGPIGTATVAAVPNDVPDWALQTAGGMYGGLFIPDRRQPSDLVAVTLGDLGTCLWTDLATGPSAPDVQFNGTYLARFVGEADGLDGLDISLSLDDTYIFPEAAALAVGDGFDPATEASGILREWIILAPLGDLNGDGFTEVVVQPDGSPLVGVAYLNWGPLDGEIEGGEVRIDRTGLAGVGDVDHDGRDDVAAGLNLFVTDSTTLHHSVDAGAAASSSLPEGYFVTGEGSGDFNRDGALDVVTRGPPADWGPETASSLAVFLGPLDGALEAPDAALSGTTSSGHLGYDVGVGDVTGDGNADALTVSLYPAGIFILAGLSE